ncbi:uncharacterized protein LOC127851398 [Dreissena polymorpha]|uniref:non-specific serine/threonine protein kinase n=1 Tax=Dreissena polymorpha TaxID=45954 RepID=A0A9D4D046_DREPO|nr:uncharacterized protein LOC127851398 [Dreissena polymorpha]XP_052241122.1 uncharacterized protein LOC127851398 [Dreissena polymorpha]KAH3736696.1 hypothetical protein DPMN_043269 [Dreissena polymorpha]
METKERVTEDASKTQFDKKKKVGNYLLGKIVGEGSFAKVRQGLHIIAREKVAVKIVPKKAVLLREYVKRSVRREAVLLQKLEHPNIVHLFEIMETENSYYLVLEYADGGEFIKYLSDRQRLSEDESRKYIRQMASAVDHMHMSNITHRDLKLENLLLDKDMNIKIIDFGQSNVFYGDTSLNTQCGSPMYAAPEIFCSRKYGSAVDIWSMGICLYAMLSGKLPFMPDPPNNLTLLHSLILRGVRVPDHVSDTCANLIARMLAVDVYHRITMDDLLLHPWLHENHETPLVIRQPPIGKLYPTVPKSPIVNYMTTVFNFLEDDVFYSVIERKMNAVAATYHLLQRRYDAGIHIVGLSMTMPSANTFQTSLRTADSGKTWNERVEFPLLPSENVVNDDSEITGPKAKLKSYIQLLKDSKLRSAQSQRSGNALRHKDLTLRRYKTRADMTKYTHTREETGFLPDFILTYTQEEPSQKPARKLEKSFEWEQTCIVSRKEPSSTKANNPDNAKYRIIFGKSADHQERVKHTDADGRKTADLSLPVPPTSPVSPFQPKELDVYNRSETGVDISIGAQSLKRIDTFEQDSKHTDKDTERKEVKPKDIQVHVVKKDSAKSPRVSDPYGNESWSTFQRQKTQLAKTIGQIDRRSNHVAFQYGLPITKPKTLTTREARSYFEEFEHAKVIGQGRRLLERTNTSTKIEDTNGGNWNRKSYTADAHRDLPDIRHHASAFTRSPPGGAGEIAFRTVDANGILHFPSVTLQAEQTIFEVHPPMSPPRQTVEDGVTDIIRVHITSSAKY